MMYSRNGKKSTTPSRQSSATDKEQKIKAELTKYGPKHDYRGAHVTLTYQGRELLGTVKDIWYCELTGVYRCAISHFCGDPWPIEPRLGALEILERTYEDDYRDAITGANPKAMDKLNKALRKAWNL